MKMRMMLAAIAACLAFSPGLQANSDWHTTSIQNHDGAATLAGSVDSGLGYQAVIINSDQGAYQQDTYWAKHEHQMVLVRNKGDNLGLTMAVSHDQARSAGSVTLLTSMTNNRYLASDKGAAYANSLVSPVGVISEYRHYVSRDSGKYILLC
jgi:hypothetical protein